MPHLFMLLIGCTPPGRHTEQHDVFFGVGKSIRDLVPLAIAFWPEAKDGLHLDAWRAVTNVNGYHIKVIEQPGIVSEVQLFFINLGGYKPGEFEEFHYKMIVAAPDKAAAIKMSKQTAFFKHTGFKGANSHIDDKFGVDVDDIFSIPDILAPELKIQYSLAIEPAPKELPEDELHLGYFRTDRMDKWAPKVDGVDA
ncbi:MAG: DUF1543 domain-containing protein [Ferruginibacter sp.]